MILDTREAFAVLDALLDEHRAAIRKRVRILFAVVEDGTFLLDTHSPEMIRPEYDEEVDVSVLTNRRTLTDFVLGRFEMEHPEAEHVFVWGGDAAAWGTLADAMSGAKPTLQGVISAMKGDR